MTSTRVNGSRAAPNLLVGRRAPRAITLTRPYLSVMRDTSFEELEIRMEFYNMPNKFIPSNPDTGIGSSTMGRSTGIFGGNYGREIQYTGRFIF